MRTAEEYITTWKDINSTDGVTHRMVLVEHAIVAINECAKEVAMDFHRWCLNDSLIKFLNDQPFQTLIPHPTDDQLFERFLSEKNK